MDQYSALTQYIHSYSSSLGASTNTGRSGVIISSISLDLSLCPFGVPYKKPRLSQEEQVMATALYDPPALKLYEDHWKIKKVLTKSDIDGSSRLLLANNPMVEYVLSSMDQDMARMCRTNTGARFQVWDADEGSPYQLVLKKWAKARNFVLTSNWKKDFVTRKGLEEGDEVGLAWDGTQFYFKLLKKNNVN